MSARHGNDTQLIYGRNPVIEAITAGKSFERVYLRDNLTGEFEKEVRQKCKEREIPLKKVPQIKLDKLAFNRNHQGIVGIGSVISYQQIAMLIPHLYEQGVHPSMVLLDNIQDVRNMGAVARSVEAFGCHGLILSGKNSAMITQDSIKTSSGALTRLHVCREKNTIDTINELKSYGIKIVGTTIRNSQPIYEVDLKPPVCIVLGSEGKGLHHSVEATCDQLISIPQKGSTDSLNVSVAAGIILYEISRQQLNK